ncbi:hypothetical protein QJS04_geneDACA010129 [Acorus gramineus]|uniref:Uncharacterized protein n=1 Tax=Acorus gramineus TaxID=55184 RepID=A0AAV9BG82_ACOGR|nr:hypothetical protein QJS04_geneDACA010129 [Acorus gramineus]
MVVKLFHCFFRSDKRLKSPPNIKSEVEESLKQTSDQLQCVLQNNYQLFNKIIEELI